MLKQAAEAYARKDLPLAERLCKDILVDNPVNVDALQVLGVLQWELKNDLEKAVELLSAAKAIESTPKVVYSLGAVLLSAKRPEEAIQAFRSYPLWQQDQKILKGLMTAYKGSHDWADRAMVVDCLLKLGPVSQADEAQLLYKRAQFLKELGRVEEAKEGFQKCLELDPKHENARFKLAIVSGNPDGLDTCPDRYVAALFDGYSGTFDHHLVEKLQYHTPAAMYHACQKAWEELHPGSSMHWQRCADLGCGTGLAGVLYRAHTQFLAGVDLSPGMIREAQKKKCYDKLVVAGLKPFLEQATGPQEAYDLILAADVFVYVGNMKDTFEALPNALHPGGWFVFSTERTIHEALAPQRTLGAPGSACQCCPGFTLGDSGRFHHCEAYIRALAVEAGLSVLSVETLTLRMNGGKPVFGNIYICIHNCSQEP
jgi:predicted TPR repeat methyltransferase